MSNILEFPKHKIVREAPVEPERIQQMKALGLQKSAAGISEDVTHILLHDLDNLGIDTTTPEFFKDFYYLSEVIAATVYRSLGIEHPLQKFITENVHIETQDGPLPEEDDEETETLQ